MRGRLLFLAGLATGYVLGSRAGRRAYDRLAAKARELWGDPNLQKVVAQTEQAAREAAALAQTKVTELIDQAATAANSQREKAGSVVQDVSEAASDVVEDASDVVEDASAKAKDAVKDTRESDTD